MVSISVDCDFGADSVYILEVFFWILRKRTKAHSWFTVLIGVRVNVRWSRDGVVWFLLVVPSCRSGDGSTAARSVFVTFSLLSEELCGIESECEVQTWALFPQRYKAHFFFFN